MSKTARANLGVSLRGAVDQSANRQNHPVKLIKLDASLSEPHGTLRLVSREFNPALVRSASLPCAERGRKKARRLRGLHLSVFVKEWGQRHGDNGGGFPTPEEPPW